MTNTSNQGLRQAAVRAQTGTAYDYQGDFQALMTADGIAVDRTYNGRLILWLQGQLSSTTPDLPGLLQEYAVARSVTNWDAVTVIP